MRERERGGRERVWSKTREGIKMCVCIYLRLCLVSR